MVLGIQTADPTQPLFLKLWSIHADRGPISPASIIVCYHLILGWGRGGGGLDSLLPNRQVKCR